MRTSVYARALASISVVFVATLIVATRSESQSSFGGPTEAPTGFVVESNGFAEEFCANAEAPTTHKFGKCQCCSHGFTTLDSDKAPMMAPPDTWLL